MSSEVMDTWLCVFMDVAGYKKKVQTICVFGCMHVLKDVCG